MFKLPFNAPLTVIPFQNSLEETFGFRQTDSKLLGGHFIPGFGQLYFSLYCDDEGFFTQRGKPNQHIPGLFGDAFVGAHFASDREIDDTPSGNWWDTHNERTAFGYPIPEQRMNTLLEELRFKVLVMFNPLKKLKDDFTMQLVHRTMREDHRSMFIRLYHATRVKLSAPRGRSLYYRRGQALAQTRRMGAQNIWRSYCLYGSAVSRIQLRVQVSYACLRRRHLLSFSRTSRPFEESVAYEPVL
jgi:hypothetical protein